MSEAGAYSTDQSVGDSRARGRRDNPVVQSGFKSTEAYAPSAMSETDSVAPVLTSAFHLNPLPQSRTNDGPMPTLQVSPQSELQEKRGKFIDRFSEGDWNDPNAVYPELSTALTQIKALVVAIDYGPSYHLPATYTDACSIIEMLENQFRYPPKCIRVLADMVDRENNKDARWPNKANIIKGLEWLSENSSSTSKRFLFFWIQQKLTGRVAVVSVAGHGYSQDFKNGEDNYTEEGILPRDYLSIVPYEERRKPHPKEAIDKSTILLDVELNQCLVKGLADGLKLTVMFDCCYSGGLSESVPDFRDMSHLRSRHLFARQPTQMIGQPGVRKLCAPLGNLLDLPVKVELGGSEPIKALARSSLPEIPGGMYYEPNEFSAFPEKCQVVSWCACDGSQLAHEDGKGGRFTSAFMKGLVNQRGPNEISTYRILNRYILDEFIRHNEDVDRKKGSEINTEDADKLPILPRASMNKNPVRSEDIGYQYPKLYVSESIAEDFADKVVEI